MDNIKYLYSSISKSIDTNAFQLIRNKDKNKGDSFQYTIFSNDSVRNNETIKFKITIVELEVAQEKCIVYKKMKLEVRCIEPKYEEIFNIYFYDEKISKELISQDIRKSKTFVFDDTNTYETDHFIFVVSERGFHLCARSAASQKDEYNEKTIDRFDRFLNLYLLAVAYNIKMDNFLEKGAELYSDNMHQLDNIMDFNESIHAFDLQYFFENPVKLNRYETYNVWKLIFAKYRVKDKHDEVKMQVLSLTDILVKNKEKLLEKKEKNIRKREDKFHKHIAVLGIYLAIIPIFIEVLNNCSTLMPYKLYILVMLLCITITIFLILYKKSDKDV